ncbi:ABC transporter permease [Butyrivibrio sp. INlla21]|uniref:ABC transporter permease n=1 Tax=Butyrivibrio sp. INlla21 TaxID=1520811 RepID=UPI0008E63958|nr:ABC transporter permease [Butyrivibrio sp. INlla21]SFU47020.1 MacB-like core domain-containing protein [Butyrivibrio sp. INlla21]
MKTDKILAFINRIKEKALKSKKIVLLVILLLLVDIILGLISRYLTGLLPEQHEAERWSEDRRMAQVSVFFTEDQLIDQDFIKKMEFNFGQMLVNDGIVSEEDAASGKSAKPQIVETIDVSKTGEDNASSGEGASKNEARLFTSCYSAQGITTMSFEKKTAENVTTIGVGGDFFLFHPLELVSGQFFGANDLMQDGVVIDEDLAWQLFGSNDVAGQMITINEVPHYVTGVVKRQEGKMSEASGLNASMAYISYDSLCKYGTILSGRTKNVQLSEDGKSANFGGINCYEIVSPNPVDGLVKKDITESTGLDQRYISVIDNTDRFTFFSLINVISTFITRSMWNKAIFYPYWENAARGYEDILALILLIRLICRATLILMAVIFIVNLYRHKTWTVSGVVSYLSDKKYDYEVRRKEKKENKRKEKEEE